MGDERSRRVNDALSSLVQTFVPPLQDEDKAIAEERHEEALDLAKSIIEGYILCEDFADLC